MKRIFWLLTLFLALQPLRAQNHVPGDILVQFRTGVSSKNGLIDPATMQQNNVSINRCVSASWNVWLLNTAPGNESNAISFLASQPNVITVQLNHYLEKRGVVPNDSLFSLAQWNLLNTGQGGATPGVDINATNAWAITTGGYTALGDTIVIAVIDGGMDLNHEDLSFWKNTREIPDNGIDDDHNGYIDDYNGWNAAEHNDDIIVDQHGTHVCGIAAAKGNNKIGVCGVNWTALIMPLVLETYTEDEVVEAYTYIYDQRRDYNNSNGARGTFVVATNSSFGIDNGQPSDYPLWCAMYDSMGKAGILSAAATTNNGVDVDDVGDVPTACPSNYLVTVTDMEHNGRRNPAAGFGLTTIDLEAPGTGITSTWPYNTYSELSGTSMASPHVAGAIALLYAAGCVNFMQAYHDAPDNIALKVKQYILAGVDSTVDMLGASVSGGRLDVYNSMQLLLNEFCVSCITASLDTQSVSCYGGANGSASINVSGGKPPYTFLWSNGESASAISGLSAGTYNVQVSDSLHCSKYFYFKITQPDPFLAGFTITTQPDSGQSNRVVLTRLQGGIAPYTFKWSNGDTTQDLQGIATGVYYVTVTDSNHCSISDTIPVGTTGINEPVLAGQVKTFPNPATGDVQLILPASFNNTTVQIIDLPGQILWSRQLSSGTYTLPFASLGKGVYILRFTQGDMEFVRKIVRL